MIVRSWMVCAVGLAVACAMAGAAPIRVACVGDSITAESATNGPLQSYPYQLARMLGDGWEVENFGRSGRTALHGGDTPYVATPTLAKALAFKPDIVVIQLGTNDTKEWNWKFKDQFAADYKALIAQFQALETKPRIFLCRPPFVWGENKFKISEENLVEELPMIDAIARDMGLPEIDNYAVTQSQGTGHFSDNVHPDREGTLLLAKTVYQALTGKPFAGEMPSFIRGEWNGFEQRSFATDGCLSYLVLPKVPLAGNPWILRTDLFGVDAQADAALLAKGYHLAYLDTETLYGAPAALDHLDKFYDFLRAEYHLFPKAVVEAVSGGGLAGFNWAARHPDRVAAICADGAALDFKSWPGGKGKGKASPGEWKRLLLAYGLTEEAVMAYPGNPIDNLAPLAAAKIPLLGVYGAADADCVPEENIVLADRRYRDLGGKSTLIPKLGAAHRPLGLADPAPIVDFVLAQAPSPSAP